MSNAISHVRAIDFAAVLLVVVLRVLGGAAETALCLLYGGAHARAGGRLDALGVGPDSLFSIHLLRPSLYTYRLNNQMPALNMLPNSVALVGLEQVFGQVAPSHWLCLG